MEGHNREKENHLAMIGMQVEDLWEEEMIQEELKEVVMVTQEEEIEVAIDHLDKEKIEVIIKKIKVMRDIKGMMIEMSHMEVKDPDSTIINLTKTFDLKNI